MTRSGYTIDNKDMANPNTNAELGAEAPVEAESPRTPRFSLVEGLRKVISEVGAVLGLKILARTGTSQGQEEALNFAQFKAARDAGVAHGDAPDRLAAYQRGENATLKGEELREAA